MHKYILILLLMTSVLAFSQTKEDAIPAASEKTSQDAKQSHSDIIMTGLIGGVIGGTISFFFRIAHMKYLKNSNNTNELQLLFGEMKDIKRHCNANLEVLNKIDLSKGIPSQMHFKKMKVSYYSIICSTETFKAIKPVHANLIYDLKLIIRNIDIEIDTIIQYLADPHYNIKTMLKYILYLKHKFEYVQDRLAYVEDEIKNSKQEEYKGKIRSKYIVYH